VGYNNDNRTPRDRLSEGFISELLASEVQGFVNSEHDCHGALCGDRNKVCRFNDAGAIRVMPTAEVKPETDTCQCDDSCSCENNCQNDNVCGCGLCSDFTAPKLTGVPLAMVYSPYQEWENLYTPEEGHARGTIFKCLDMPFYPTGCFCKSQCRQHNHR
jgi:hypothetical protein